MRRTVFSDLRYHLQQLGEALCKRDDVHTPETVWQFDCQCAASPQGRWGGTPSFLLSFPLRFLLCLYFTARTRSWHLVSGCFHAHDETSSFWNGVLNIINCISHAAKQQQAIKEAWRDARMVYYLLTCTVLIALMVLQGLLLKWHWLWEREACQQGSELLAAMNGRRCRNWGR